MRIGVCLFVCLFVWLFGWMDGLFCLSSLMDGWMDGWIIFPLVYYYYYYYYYCYFHFVLITSVQARQTFSFAFLVMPSSECLCQKPTPFDEWMKEGKGREGKGRKEGRKGGGFVLFWSFQGAAAVSLCVLLQRVCFDLSDPLFYQVTTHLSVLSLQSFPKKFKKKKKKNSSCKG